MKWRAKYSYPLSLPTSWQELPNGSAYFTALESYFEKWFARLAGQRLLKIGALSVELPCQTECQQILLTEKTTPDLTALCLEQGIVLIEDDRDELPFGDSTVDACLLAHNLNFSQDPHQLLREIQRILSDDGYLLISLLNPVSKLIFKRHLNEFEFRHLCRWRVIDWLELLGFEIIEQQNLPLKHEFSWFSSQSVIVAQKHSIPLSLQPQKARLKMPEIFQPAQAFKDSAPEN